MYILKWFRFIIAKIYKSQKRSKGIKNWKITYSVILSVLSNKTNLILGFSSPFIPTLWVTILSRTISFYIFHLHISNNFFFLLLLFGFFIFIEEKNCFAAPLKLFRFSGNVLTPLCIYINCCWMLMIYSLIWFEA